MKKAEAMLNLAGQLLQFSSQEDKLSRMVDELGSEELSLSSLELVSAAAGSPMASYSNFDKLLKSREN